MFKKMIVLAMTISLIFSSVSTTSAAAGDKPSAWAQEMVSKAIALGIVPERLQSKYQSPITREEFAELIVNTVFAKVIEEAGSGRDNGNEPYWTREKLLARVTLDVEFEDAKQEHVKLAYILGSINGISDTKFGPDNLITRQEAAVMMVNISHIGNRVSYVGNDLLQYSDYNKVASWALPAVRAAWELGFMRGMGGKFDYAGKITREQSIMSMMNFMKEGYSLALKGNILVYEEYDELRYKVGKNNVQVSYAGDADSTSKSYLEKSMRSNWITYSITETHNDKYAIEKAIVLYAFNSQLRSSDFIGIVAPTLESQPSKWDYGWMTVSTFNSDSLLEFRFAPIPGYMSTIGGYHYGYPQVPVTVKRIK